METIPTGHHFLFESLCCGQPVAVETLNSEELVAPSNCVSCLEHLLHRLSALTFETPSLATSDVQLSSV